MKILERRSAYILLLGIIFFLLLYKLEWFGNPDFQPPFLQTSGYCLSFFEQGKLYSGEPYCFQGPVVYIVAYILSVIFSSFTVGSYTLYFFALFLTALLTQKICIKEINRTSLFLIFLCILIFGRMFINDFTTVLVVLFTLTGFYILCYKNWARKEWIAGILFSFAIFSKPHNAPLLVGAILIYYYWGLYKQEDEKQRKIVAFLKKQQRSMLSLGGSTVFLFFIFLLVFNGFIFYNYIIHSYYPVSQSYYSIFVDILLFKYWYDGFFVLFYVGAFISAIRYMYYEKNDIFMFVSVFCFLVLMFVVGNKLSVQAQSDNFRYYVPFLPFYLINLFKFGEEFIQEKRKEVIGLVLAILIILGGIVYVTLGAVPFSYYMEEKSINVEKMMGWIKYTVEAPLFLIPPQDGKILTNINYSERYGGFKEDNLFLYIPSEKFVYLIFKVTNSSLDPDMAIAPYLVEAGKLESLDPYMHSEEIIVKDPVNDMIALNYSVIIRSTSLRFNQIISAINESYDTLDNYCKVSMPFIGDGINKEKYHLLVWDIWFLEKEDCVTFSKVVYDYYSKNFNTFCGYGRDMIFLIQNGIKEESTFDMKCISAGQLLRLNNSVKIQLMMYCLLIFGYVLSIMIKKLWKYH